MLNIIGDSPSWVNKPIRWKRLFRTIYDCVCFWMSTATRYRTLRKSWGKRCFRALLLEQSRFNISYSYLFNWHEDPHWSPCFSLLSTNRSQWFNQISSVCANPLLANKLPESPSAFSIKLFHQNLHNRDSLVSIFHHSLKTSAIFNKLFRLQIL